MQPYDVAYTGAVKGFIVSGVLAAAWVTARLVVPRIAPNFYDGRLGKAVLWAWLFLAIAWFFDAGSLWLGGYGHPTGAWVSYGLSILFRLMLLGTVVASLIRPKEQGPVER